MNLGVKFLFSWWDETTH